MNQKVLQKLLKGKTKEELVEKFLKPAPAVKKPSAKRPGRPLVPKEKKAKNFTLCLAPQYLEFLDKMVVKDPKVQGRGRKIRFIIERFIEHEKRSIAQLRVLKESLALVQKALDALGSRVKKGQKLELTAKEKAEISKAVDQVHLLLKILSYSPKTLQKMLPKDEWALLSFSLDWKTNNRGGVIL